MNQIEVYLQPGGWVARYKGPHAAKVRDLFGTDVLPTAFTAQADSEKVRTAIQQLNPGVAVTVQS